MNRSYLRQAELRRAPGDAGAVEAGCSRAFRRRRPSEAFGLRVALGRGWRFRHSQLRRASGDPLETAQPRVAEEVGSHEVLLATRRPGTVIRGWGLPYPLAGFWECTGKMDKIGNGNFIRSARTLLRVFSACRKRLECDMIAPRKLVPR